MVNREPTQQRPSLLLTKKRSAPIPLDATKKHLTALLDGKDKKKQPKQAPTTKTNRHHHDDALQVTTTQSQSQPAAIFAPKVAGLAMCSLSQLPGASSNNSLKRPLQVLQQPKKKRTSAHHLAIKTAEAFSTARVSLDVPVKPREIEATTSAPVDNNKYTKAAATATYSKMGLQLQPLKRARYSTTTVVSSKTSKSFLYSFLPTQQSTEKPRNDKDAKESSIEIETKDYSTKPATTTTAATTTSQENRTPVVSSLPLDSAAKTTGTSSTQPKQSISVVSARQDMPRPESSSSQWKQAKASSSNNNNNNNFVKLNLRNQAGACRGARNKKQLRKKYTRNEYATYNKSNDATKSTQPMLLSSTGIDAVDDFVDGVYQQPPEAATTTTATKKKKKSASTIPLCSGHQAPCKLLTVKKNTENKGRQFYCCAFGRSEQCSHFEWADDTIQAAQFALLKNSSTSGFIARQVAAYMVHVKQLTIPELQVLLKRHQLAYHGKKEQLLTRMAIWVRDQVATAVKKERSEDAEDNDDIKKGQDEGDETGLNDASSEDESDSSDDEDGSDSDSDDSSVEELEIVGRKSSLKPLQSNSVHDDDSTVDDEDDGNSSETSSKANEGNQAVHQTSHSGLRKTLKQLFGHSDFRQGQEWAIRRCLDHKRTLLVAPTGFGKSLCYTMTSALMDGVCIVVSPLLSLIQDQLRLLPPGVPAVTLSGNMTKSKMVATLDDIARGRIKIVFVSPERLTSASFRRLFRWKWNAEQQVQERMFPTVSLLCVDEAHCLSQWAHHFRPSYLRLRSMLTWIQPQSVLAITATAGPKVVQDICHTLGITQVNVSSDTEERLTTTKPVQEDCGVHVMKSDRDNIDVSCYVLSTQEERLGKLIEILKPKEKQKSKTSDDRAGILSSGSVIIYVWRQRDAEAVAENIQAADVRGGVTVYHGGMDAAARSKAQSKFLRGKIRICVATIAFGLGINKEDVVGVVHMYLSASPEHFLQETGRAGRNGRPAHAIALILDDEVLIRHSLGHSDLLAKSQVKFFLQCLASTVEKSLALLPKDRAVEEPIHVGLTVADCIINCDCRAETIETLVSLLELRDDSLVQVEGWFYDRAQVAPRRRTLDKLANQEPLARAILECATCNALPAGDHTEDARDIEDMSSKAGGQRLVDHSFGSYSFSVAQCANCLGSNAEPRHVFAALRRLEQSGDIDLVLETSDKARALNLKISSRGLNLLRQGSDALNDLTEELTDRLNTIAVTSCNKVVDLDYILRQVASASIQEGSYSGKPPSLRLFQTLIGNYFEAEGRGDMLAPDLPPFSDVDKHQILVDIRSILSHFSTIEESLTVNSENATNLTVRDYPDYASLVIAKFMHGIPATARCAPSLLWQHVLFGRMQSSKFTELCEVVRKIISG